MLAGSSLVAVAHLASWLVLVGSGAFRADALLGLGPLTVAIVAPLAISGLVGTISSMWRGPPLIAFSPEQGHPCSEGESEPVRAYAQLRGTIGGAGHVHPERLAFPAVAWGAALAAGARPFLGAALEPAAAFPAGVAVVAAFGAWLFPARPYWYREVMGGGAVVFPPEAVAALLARERTEDEPGLAEVHATGRALPILRQAATPVPGAVDAAFTGLRAGGASEQLPPRVEHLGGAALAAVGPGVPRARAQRYPVHQRLIVEQDGREIVVATLNVSTGGLAVHWPEELPVLGEQVVVKLDEGLRLRALDAKVCWNHAGAGAQGAVGMQVTAQGRSLRAWQDFVGAVARGGAPSA